MSNLSYIWQNFVQYIFSYIWDLTAIVWKYANHSEGILALLEQAETGKLLDRETRPQ